MRLITDDKSEKVVFALVNIALGYVWIRFVARLIARWSLVDTQIRDPVGLFIVFFSLLWLSILLGGKRRFAPAPVLAAGGVLMAVYEIAKRFM